MFFISVTRLRVRSIFYLLPFFKANEASVKQLIKTKGFLQGKELIDKHLTFWTVTMWQNDSQMKEFRNSSAHRKAMQNLPNWCSEASYIHWTQIDNYFPDWQVASEKLLTEGKLTKVRKPTVSHIENSFPTVKWFKLERNFKPVNE